MPETAHLMGIQGAAQQEVTAHGRHLRVEHARLNLLPDPVPDVYFGGSSEAGIRVAAEHADVYLSWGEPPDAVAEKIARVRTESAGRGRSLRFGLRVHAISRDTAAEAWRQAGYLLERVSDEVIDEVQQGLALSESEGQRRMRALHHGGDRRDLEVYPNLWAGVGLVRGGAGTSLVGSHEEVADLIGEYAAAGVTEFILSGYPHLEEAYWFGEGVLPVLQRRGLWQHPAPRREPEQVLRPFASTHQSAPPEPTPREQVTTS